MKLLDRFAAGGLFAMAIEDSLLIPKNYTGRIWIFGTCLALLFAALLNWLRIRNGGAVPWLRISCGTANVAMIAFDIGLMVSIGRLRTLQNLQLPLLAVLLLTETIFTFGKNA